MGMFRRPAPESGHAQHDTLLIAQYASRDPLTPEQVVEASGLVGSCAECASLASDLGVISQAVATESVPRRRRDFRLDAETASGLQGSPLHRFMRRLAMPGSAPLRPLAAGVMSIGLVLVVAGNVIPTAEQATSVSGGQAAPGTVTEEAVDPSSIEVGSFAADGGTPGLDTSVRDRDALELPLGGALEPGPTTSADAAAKRVRSENEIASDVSGEINAQEPAIEAVDRIGGETGQERLNAADAESRRDEVDGASLRESAPSFADDQAATSTTGNDFGEEDGARAQKATLGDNDAFGQRAGNEAAAPVAAESMPAAAVSTPPGRATGLVAAGDLNDELAFRSVAQPGDNIADLLVPLGLAFAIAGFLALLLLWVSRLLNPDPLGH